MIKIYNILSEVRPEYDFHCSNDFINEGMLDSFDIITLVTMLEEAYDVLIDALDILPENFCSAEAIAAVVRKSGGVI